MYSVLLYSITFYGVLFCKMPFLPFADMYVLHVPVGQFFNSGICLFLEMPWKYASRTHIEQLFCCMRWLFL